MGWCVGRGEYVEVGRDVGVGLGVGYGEDERGGRGVIAGRVGDVEEGADTVFCF